MYVAFYRWKIKPGLEGEFVKQWDAGTKLFRDQQGTFGSRLHAGDDGTYFAYAQWPDRQSYQSKRELSPEHKEILKKMSECVLEAYPTVLGDVRSDFLVHSPQR